MGIWLNAAYKGWQWISWSTFCWRWCWRLGAALAVVLMRRSDTRAQSAAQAGLADTVQRVEQSLRDQERDAGRAGQRAAGPQREGDRPGHHRPARAAGPHRRGAEEDRRSLDAGGEPAADPDQQAGARRLRRGAAERPGVERAAAVGLCAAVHAVERRARRLPAEAAQPAGLDRDRRQVPARELPRCCARSRPATRRRWPLAQRAFQAAMRKHITDIRDKYIVPGETAEIGAAVPAVGGDLRRAARQLRRHRRRSPIAPASGSCRRPP